MTLSMRVHISYMSKLAASSAGNGFKATLFSLLSELLFGRDFLMCALLSHIHTHAGMASLR